MTKHKVVLDFDDTFVKSSERIIQILNKRFGENKSIENLKDWNFNSLFPNLPKGEVEKIFNSKEFFESDKKDIGDCLTLNDSALSFLVEFSNDYYYVFCSKGLRNNLSYKKEFIASIVNLLATCCNIKIEYEFIGIEMNQDDLDKGHVLDKSKIDFSDCLFAVDDNSFALCSMNVPVKILITNGRDVYWNKTPINEKNFYVVNDFKDIIEMCRFDKELRKNGEFID